MDDRHSEGIDLDGQSSGLIAQVANKPIVHHVLDVLEAAGLEDIVVACSSRSGAAVRECVRARESRNGMRLRFAEQEGPLDLEDALMLAAPIIGGSRCVAHLASGLLGEPLEPMMNRIQRDSPDLLITVQPGQAPDGHLSVATQKMLHIAELNPERTTLSMAGLLLFGPDALRSASTVVWKADSEVDLTDVAARIAAAGGSFEVLPVNQWRRYAGDPADLLELNRIALDRLDCDVRRPRSDDNRIEGRVWIDEQASVRASVIVGPVVIGPGAHVTDAYIGPYTSIGAGARVEGAEIERSIIAAGASITHIGGRLVASVVGRDARIFRDFSLPRAIRLLVGAGTEVALC